jgi:hypothetical protein
LKKINFQRKEKNLLLEVTEDATGANTKLHSRTKFFKIGIQNTKYKKKYIMVPKISFYIFLFAR